MTSAGAERLILVLGLCLPVPVLAATGLSLPLPTAVERLAAALVPWAEAGVLSEQEFTRVAAGSIVFRPEEVQSKAEALRLDSTSEIADAPFGKGSKTPAVRPVMRERPVTRERPVRSAAAATATSTATEHLRSAPEPLPEIHSRPTHGPTRSETTAQPDVATPQPKPAPVAQTKREAGQKPTPNADRPPKPKAVPTSKPGNSNAAKLDTNPETRPGGPPAPAQEAHEKEKAAGKPVDSGGKETGTPAEGAQPKATVDPTAEAIPGPPDAAGGHGLAPGRRG